MKSYRLKDPIEISYEDSLSNTIECHCSGIARYYKQRTYTNKLGLKVISRYYSCDNCGSRIRSDYIPSIDESNGTDVLQLLTQLGK